MKPLGLVGDAPAPEHLPELRRLAVAYLALAGKDRFGRRQGDPVFEAVTEGRHSCPTYSSCADLGHWLLYRLGCRAPWINRNEASLWRQGLNLNLLTAAGCGGGNPLAEKVQLGAMVHPGDLLVTHTKTPARSHVIAVCSAAELVEGSNVVCVEYGQFDDKYRRPCGRFTIRSLWHGLSDLDSILPLEAVAGAERMAAAVEPGEYLASVVSELPSLGRGSSGGAVRWWCETLGEHRLDPGLPPDRYGPKAELATRQFRTLHGLPDGEQFSEAFRGVLWQEQWLAAIDYEGPR